MNFVMEQFSEILRSDSDIVKERNANPLAFLPSSPSLDAYTAFLHEEMRQCYLQGLDHAAIVMACSLLEYAIKSGIYQEAHFKSGRKFNQEEWDEIEKKSFAKLINWGKKLGLISKAGHKRLESFRRTARNFYMHGTTPTQVKDLVLPFHVAGWKTSEIEQKEIELRQEISLQRVFRILFDRQLCDSVIPFVDQVVREILNRKEERITEADAKSPPPKPTWEQLQSIMEKMKEKGGSGFLAVTQAIPDAIRDAVDDVTEGHQP